MDTLDIKLKRLEEEMRKEAAQRLKTIKPNKIELSKEFENNGTIYVQDISILAKTKNSLKKANKVEMDVVHYMENEQGNLPYFIIKDATEFGVVYYFFYISYDKGNWSIERSSIQKYGQNYIEPYVFQVNAGMRLEDDETPINTLLSKFTRLKIKLD